MSALLHLLACLIVRVHGENVHINDDNYEYWCVGNCTHDVSTVTTPGIILSGGGTDVDAAFKQQITWSGGGDFLVLRTTGTDAYNSWIYGLGTCNSVSTLLLKNRIASSEPFVVNKVRAIEALFFAGGNQASYVTFWTDTPLHDAILDRASSGIPVGGTSAGLAILGNWIYTALNDTVTSQEALQNPYSSLITLGPRFIPFKLLNHFITDSHFVTRDRMGRLVTFVARLLADKNDTSVYGIGIDEKTSILIDEKGVGRVVGLADSSVAYVIHSNDPPAKCRPEQALTYQNLGAYKLQARYNDQYDFVNHVAIGPKLYLISAINGVLPDPY